MTKNGILTVLFRHETNFLVTVQFLLRKNFSNLCRIHRFYFYFIAKINYHWNYFKFYVDQNILVVSRIPIMNAAPTKNSLKTDRNILTIDKTDACILLSSLFTTVSGIVSLYGRDKQDACRFGVAVATTVLQGSALLFCLIALALFGWAPDACEENFFGIFSFNLIYYTVLNIPGDWPLRKVDIRIIALIFQTNTHPQDGLLRKVEVRVMVIFLNI